MDKPTEVVLDPPGNSALLALANSTGSPPEQVVTDATACLVAARGMKDFILGTRTAPPIVREKKGLVTWKSLDDAARLIDDMQSKIDTARLVLRHARLAKGRYASHNELWWEVLYGLSLNGRVEP